MFSSKKSKSTVLTGAVSFYVAMGAVLLPVHSALAFACPGSTAAAAATANVAAAYAPVPATQAAAQGLINKETGLADAAVQSTTDAERAAASGTDSLNQSTVTGTNSVRVTQGAFSYDQGAMQAIQQAQNYLGGQTSSLGSLGSTLATMASQMGTLTAAQATATSTVAAAPGANQSDCANNPAFIGPCNTECSQKLQAPKLDLMKYAPLIMAAMAAMKAMNGQKDQDSKDNATKTAQANQNATDAGNNAASTGQGIANAGDQTGSYGAPASGAGSTSPTQVASADTAAVPASSNGDNSSGLSSDSGLLASGDTGSSGSGGSSDIGLTGSDSGGAQGGNLDPLESGTTLSQDDITGTSGGGDTTAANGPSPASTSSDYADDGMEAAANTARALASMGNTDANGTDSGAVKSSLDTPTKINAALAGNSEETDPAERAGYKPKNKTELVNKNGESASNFYKVTFLMAYVNPVTHQINPNGRGAAMALWAMAKQQPLTLASSSQGAAPAAGSWSLMGSAKPNSSSKAANLNTAGHSEADIKHALYSK